MKGISFTLEAVIASILLMLALVFFFRPMSLPDSSEYSYKKLTYDSLKALNDGGKLRQYVLDNDATSISTELSSYISFLDHDVTIYNRTMNLTAIPTIAGDDVIVVSYFLAGDAGNYTAKEVRVFVWGFD